MQNRFYINFTSFLVYIKHLVYIDKEDIAMFSDIEWHLVYIVPLLPCLHRRQRWHSNAAGQNQIDIELYSYPLVCIANLIKIERYHVYIVPFPSFCIVDIAMLASIESTMSLIVSLLFYFHGQRIAMFGDTKLTLRLEHTLSNVFTSSTWQCWPPSSWYCVYIVSLLFCLNN